MYRFLRNTAIMMAAIVALLSSCSDNDERKVIPRSQLAKIYAEMLVTDQWITSTPGVRLIADTSLVYIPILEKYGYDRDDYLKSVDVYMDDPERFSRILKKSAEIIGKKIEDAEVRLAEYKRIAELPKIKVDIDYKEFFPYIKEEPYVHYYDSLTFEPDSTLMIYRLVPVETRDTLFEGVKIIVKSDTLAIKDTLDKIVEPLPEKKADTLKVISATRLIKADNPLTGKRKWESEK